MKARIGAMALALSIGAFAAGCGSSDDKKSDEAEEHASTPAQALVELGKVRSGLATALVTYKAGDKAEADKQVGDAYLEHFELVEGPLEQVDHELNEELEDGIREELRGQMQAGAPAAKVEQLVEQLDGKLEEAAGALQSQ